MKEYDCVTQFENLSNEIVYEIFDYLDIYQAYRNFYDLNIRFHNLLTLSNYPIEVNLFNISKLSFEEHYQEFFQFNSHRIRSLYISNGFIIHLIISLAENQLLFRRLQTLYLNNIDLTNSKDLFNYLFLLPNLSALTFSSNNNCYDKNMIFEQIFRLSSLKYFKISLNQQHDTTSDLLTITNEYSSPIEHLIIDSNINLEEFLLLLAYVPRLRRLSIKCLISTSKLYSEISSIILNHLTHVSIKLKYIRFDVFEPLMKILFQNLQFLCISTYMDNEYINAQKWERLITNHMTHLRIFDLQHETSSINSLHCEHLMNQFSTLFWTERKWFFTHEHNYSGRSNQGLFYSIEPYRRKDYILNNIANQCNYSYHSKNNLDAVRHIHIEHRFAIDNHSVNIPHANEVTFGKNVYISREVIANLNNSIIPLSRLTKITIDSDYISLYNIINVLCLTPNCRKLTLTSLSYDERELVSIQYNENFQNLSQKNTMKDVTVKSCTFEEIQLVVNLFRQLEHLTINVSQKDFQSIVKYLLNTNENIRYLHSLYIRSTNDIWIEKLMNIIKEIRQDDEVFINIINCFDCYLWW
ncbi:hypothetical protein I4U23_004573 [Adineta vaga]|nr:hypothetical protein I4U23_004573 [Adineta vaga]